MTFDPRKYLEYRLFWPYSSGLPGQWMSHQIDTVHWFSGLKHPRSVVANGGIYMWKDGRKNWDTITAVFDYGPADDPTTGFQVTFQSRMDNGEENPAEIYYSNGGELNLNTNKVSPEGGLTKQHAAAMNMEPNLLPEMNLENKEKVVASRPIPAAISLLPITCATGWSVYAAASSPTHPSRRVTAIPLPTL